MSAKDDKTLSFYAREADAYTSRGELALNQWLSRFLATVGPGGSILELGCGGGQDSEAMLAAGYDVTPTDGTPEMAQAAERRLGIPVHVLLFEDISGLSRYDGVWANACLLHVPRPALAGIFDRINRVLKPGGTLYASFKAGTRDGQDTLGRYYNYPDISFLRQAMNSAAWKDVHIFESRGSGYDKLPTDWLHMLALKA